MRETRTSGSEGGGIGQPILPTPIKKSANPGGFSGSALNTYESLAYCRWSLRDALGSETLLASDAGQK